jgi:hypothetical protein
MNGKQVREGFEHGPDEDCQSTVAFTCYMCTVRWIVLKHECLILGRKMIDMPSINCFVGQCEY